MNQSDISKSAINDKEDSTVKVSTSRKCMSPASPYLFDRLENVFLKAKEQNISAASPRLFDRSKNIPMKVKDTNIPHCSSDLNVSPSQSLTKRGRGRPPKRKHFTVIAEPVPKDCEDTDKNKQTVCKVFHKGALPKSPYFLVHEVLQHYPWKLLVATILLDDATTHQKVIPVLWKVLNHWPTPEAASQADIHQVASYIFPIGHNYERAQAIINFSIDFLTKKWTYPIELRGIGQYGNDCYRIFYLNEWFQVEPTDTMLQHYCQWLKSNCDRFGLSLHK